MAESQNQLFVNHQIVAGKGMKFLGLKVDTQKDFWTFHI